MAAPDGSERKGQRFSPGNQKEVLVCHSADNLLVMCMFLDR